VKDRAVGEALCAVETMEGRRGATPVGAAFERVLADLEQRLRRALVARFGVELGVDAAADAIAWAWEHRDEVTAMGNPAGYLYRVGQTAVGREVRRAARSERQVALLPRERAGPDIDVELFDVLGRLPSKQRVAVVLVHAYSYTYREVADLLGVTEAAVTNHVHRGLANARKHLEESDQ
jgi:RNA polymerase sigma factor (sigma-70 family)